MGRRLLFFLILVINMILLLKYGMVHYRLTPVLKRQKPGLIQVQPLWADVVECDLPI